MIKLYTGCLVLLIGNLIVAQAVITLKIVKHDISETITNLHEILEKQSITGRMITESTEITSSAQNTQTVTDNN